MSCKNCKKSILNSQKSSIPSPDCVDNDCSQDIACDGIATYSDCVTVVPALDCINTAAGEENLSDVLVSLDTKLCQVTSGTVKVSVSEPDTCPGYLEDKITVGDGLTIETQDLGGGCERLIIREACWEWNSVTSGTGDGKFKNGWNNTDPTGTLAQVVQYSNIKECTVKLRGLATLLKSGSPSYSPAKAIVFTLPSGKRPSVIRRFSTVIKAGNFYPCYIDIYPTGEVLILGLPTVDVQVDITFDGISFEVN